MSVFDRLVGRASAAPALTVRRSGRFEAPAGPRADDAPGATPAAERGDVQHLDPTQDSRSTDTVRHRPAAGIGVPRAAVPQSSGAGAGAGADPATPAVPGDPGRDEPRPATAPGTSGPTDPRRPVPAHQPPPSHRVPTPRPDAAPSVPVAVPAAAAPTRRPPDGTRGPLPDRRARDRGPAPANGTGPTTEPTAGPTIELRAEPSTTVHAEPASEVRTESSTERSTGVRTVSRDELLAHLAPALAADGALSRREAGRLVAVPSRSTQGDVQRRPDRPTVGLDPVDVPVQGEVHLHIDRVDVHRPDPQPAPAPRSPAPARDDHSAYLARQESRWRR